MKSIAIVIAVIIAALSGFLQYRLRRKPVHEPQLLWM